MKELLWNPYALICFAGNLLAWLAIYGDRRALRKRVRKAEALARIDVTTGLGNRRRWNERTSALVKAGESFSYIIFDIANFKAANEVLGHMRADELLRYVAEKIQASGREGDRIGGDEFAVALPDTPAEGARALRDRIEREVGEIEVAPGVKVFLTGEVGECYTGEDFDALITDTDFSLEARKVARKEALGLPINRRDTLALLIPDEATA